MPIFFKRDTSKLRFLANTSRSARVSWSARAGSSTWSAARCLRDARRRNHEPVRFARSDRNGRRAREVQVEHVLVGGVVGELIADVDRAERRHRARQREPSALRDAHVLWTVLCMLADAVE